MAVMNECAPRRIEFVEAIADRRDPDVSAPIFIDISDILASQTVRVLGVVMIGLECIAIVAEQAVIGGKPHEALIVLSDSLDPLIQRLAIRRDGNKANVVAVDYGNVFGDLALSSGRERR